jgi:hypothetical protein
VRIETWRAPRTVDARRKNRRDASVTRATDLRRRRVERVERRSGMVRRLAASDRAARLAHVEGTQNLKRGGPDRTDRRSKATGGRERRPDNRFGSDSRGRRTGSSKDAMKVRGRARRLHAEALRDRTPEPVGEAGHQSASPPTADDERTERARPAQANKAGHVDSEMARERFDRRTSVARRRQ